MNFVDSFILATAFSYLAAFSLPIQFEKKMSPITQRIIYLILWTILILAVTFFDTYPRLWVLLGIPYSFIAVYCFGGGQDWGSTGHNLLMTAWDLAMAICCFMKLTF